MYQVDFRAFKSPLSEYRRADRTDQKLNQGGTQEEENAIITIKLNRRITGIVFLPVVCEVRESFHEEVAHISVIVCPHGSCQASRLWKELWNGYKNQFRNLLGQRSSRDPVSNSPTSINGAPVKK